MYHGGEHREKQGGRGHIAGALCEGGDEEAEDDGDGPGGDGLKWGHQVPEPPGQTRLLERERERERERGGRERIS